MATVYVGEVCEFIYGNSLKEERRRPGKVPVFGSNGIVGWHDKAITAGPTIVIGRKGSIGEINWSNGPCYPIDTTYFVDKTKRPCDLRWLFFTLQSLDLTRLNKSAAVPGLNREDAYEQRIPWPSLSEQRQIVGRLERSEQLCRTRRLAVELGDNFIRTAFLKLFSNQHDSWQAVTIEELAAPKRGSIRTGPFGSQLLHSEFTDDGIAVLGIDNAVGNEFEWKERRFISPAKYEELKRYTVFPGDVLITIMGTCGRCAVVPEDIPTAVNTKHLCCITLDQSKCLPAFLHAAFLYHPEILRQLGILQKGAIMDGLNMEIIKGLRFTLPRLHVQKRFATLVERHKHLRATQREALRQAQHLLQTLLHRAYSEPT